MHVQIKEKEKDNGKETKEEAGDTNAKKGESHAHGPLRPVFEDEERYDVYTSRIGIEKDARVIPNRHKVSLPSSSDLYKELSLKYVRYEVTISTIGLFAMHTFWATGKRCTLVRERAREMLTALIIALLPHTEERHV